MKDKDFSEKDFFMELTKEVRHLELSLIKLCYIMTLPDYMENAIVQTIYSLNDIVDTANKIYIKNEKKRKKNADGD